MSSLTINIPDERFNKLKEVADKLNTTPEELVKLSIEELINTSEIELNKAIDYVMHKNKELYKKLA